MKKNNLKQNKGFTLIEIILAIAILSIILIAILNLFSFSLSSVFAAGDKSRTVADLDSIAQNIIEQANTSKFSTQNAIETYLTGTLNYNLKTSSTVMTKDAGKDINCFVGARQLITGTTTYGYPVTIVKFVGSKNRSSKITFFIIEGGV